MHTHIYILYYILYMIYYILYIYIIRRSKEQSQSIQNSYITSIQKVTHNDLEHHHLSKYHDESLASVT